MTAGRTCAKALSAQAEGRVVSQAATYGQDRMPEAGAGQQGAERTGHARDLHHGNSDLLSGPQGTSEKLQVNI